MQGWTLRSAPRTWVRSQEPGRASSSRRRSWQARVWCSPGAHVWEEVLSRATRRVFRGSRLRAKSSSWPPGQRVSLSAARPGCSSSGSRRSHARAVSRRACSPAASSVWRTACRSLRRRYWQTMEWKTTTTACRTLLPLGPRPQGPRRGPWPRPLETYRRSARRHDPRREHTGPRITILDPSARQCDAPLPAALDPSRCRLARSGRGSRGVRTMSGSHPTAAPHSGRPFRMTTSISRPHPKHGPHGSGPGGGSFTLASRRYGCRTSSMM
jgi:hypothetical protein